MDAKRIESEWRNGWMHWWQGDTDDLSHLDGVGQQEQIGMNEIQLGPNMKLTPTGLEIVGKPPVAELEEVMGFLRWVTGASRMAMADILEHAAWHDENTLLHLQGVASDWIGEQQQLNDMRVAKQYPYRVRRRYSPDVIHYTHWRLLSRAHIPESLALELLDEAVRDNLNTTEFRQLLKDRLNPQTTNQ